MHTTSSNRELNNIGQNPSRKNSIQPSHTMTTAPLLKLRPGKITKRINNYINIKLTTIALSNLKVHYSPMGISGGSHGNRPQQVFWAETCLEVSRFD